MPELDMRLIYSVRNADELIYATELGHETTVTYTREAPDGWAGHVGRIDSELVAPLAAGIETAFVCGSNGFVESSASLLLDAGVDGGAIRTERFGPTG
jgi:ferredoxin-NADP reductase